MRNTFMFVLLTALTLLGSGLAYAVVEADAQDAISARDQAAYQRLDAQNRFGVQFRPHVAVCTDSGTDAAHCDARVIVNPDRTPAVTNTVVRGLTPPQLLSAYNLSGAASGHPVIAIVDAYDAPNIAKDLKTYSSTFGLPQLPACSSAITSSSQACFQKVNQKGQTSRFPRVNSGWALEISLDVETAHAMCQNCSILLVEAQSNSYTDLMAAVDRAVAMGATVVSNSYGSNEFSSETSYDSHFNHPGVVFTFSAGDSGYGVEYPAASKYVTAVGGTSLFLNSDNSYNTEVAWSGTGSGCSAFESKPTWQTDTAGCGTRTVADVSADADPNTGAAIYDSTSYAGQSGWFQVGGTSLASPIIASVYALSGNIPSNTTENSLPYASSSNLNDVISGSNGSCGGMYLCTAGVGFDGPTGLGTPHGTSAF